MTGNQIEEMVEKLFRHFKTYTCISLHFGHHKGRTSQKFAAQVYVEGIGHLAEVKTAEGLQAQVIELMLTDGTGIANDDHLME